MRIIDWQVRITNWAINQGFTWVKEDGDTMLLRIHSEVSEAAEALRDKDELHLAEELADIFIRLVNLAEVFGIDLERAVEIKQQINEERPFLHGRKKR